MEITEPRSGTLAVVAGAVALVAAFFLGIQSDVVVSVVEPDDDVQRVLWRIAVIVIGVVVTVFAVLTVRDMTVPDGRIDRYAGPALIVSALGITGVSTLWSLLVAVSATGAALPPDAIGYIGNATVLGVLLGLGIVAAAWSLRAYSAVLEVFRHGRPGSRPKALVAIAIVIVFVLVVPVSNAFRA